MARSSAMDREVKRIKKRVTIPQFELLSQRHRKAQLLRVCLRLGGRREGLPRGLVGNRQDIDMA